MGIRSKFIGWVGSWLFNNSARQSGAIYSDDTPEDGTIYDDNQSILVPASSFDTELEHDHDQSVLLPASSFDTELVHDDDQRGNKKRKATHESLVIYDHDQGSSSAANSQPDLGWLLSNDPAVCHINEVLRYKLRRLFARANDVSTELKHDEIQPKKKPRMEVHQWLTDVYQIRDEVPNIATDGKSIQKFTSQVEELLQQGNFPHGYVLPDESPIELPLPAKNPAGNMFASNTATILEWLKNNENCIIGVYGMGGVGKTTLLRWLYNEVLKQKDIFGHPYWVTVSQNCSKLELQNYIAKVLGVNLSREGDDERKRAAILHRRLSTMGPIVLFLDDIWKWNPFLEDVEFPIEGSSCKIILSSRLYKVCKEMGCKSFVINAKVLPEGEAWNLFVDKLGHDDKLPEEAKRIARLIAKECGGLPLAIATMARSMTGVVDVCEWNDAFNELRQSSCAQGDMEEYVYSVLKYSYYHLNDWMLQNCFLSCVLYPEDFRIPREELIDGWIMEGLLDDVGSRSNQVNKGHTILNKFINSCLLEACTYYGSDVGVKMHDLMRDLAIMITKDNPCFMAKSGFQLQQVPEQEQWSKDLVKVSLSHNYIKEIPNGMAPFTPKLTVLMLDHNFRLSGISESFFIHMRALTVLNLSHTSIRRLPESVSDLENLRALLLTGCRRLMYVPCLAKLSKLRVLDLYKDYHLEKAPEGIERLKCLEKITYCPWDISEITRFNNLINSSPSLSCYRFSLCNQLCFETRYDYICGGQMNSLLVGGIEIEDENTSILLPPRINVLMIVESVVKRSNVEDVFPTLGLATELRDLSIRNCRGLKYILSSSSLGPQQGPFFEHMTLINLPDLRGIIEFGGFTFSHLRCLKIEYCPKIKVIFPHSVNLLSLPNLNYIRVSKCKELEEIFESNNGHHLNSAFGLPNLVTLELKWLPKLRRLGMNLHLCTSLEYLEIYECKELEEIFESGGRSSETETLGVDHINVCNPQPSPNPISFLPKLKFLSLLNLPKLGSIYKELHLCTSLEELEVHLCTSLEELEVVICPKFTSPKPIFTLCKLRKLKLQGLPKLSSIHRGLLFCTSLEEFSIEGCIKLKRVPLSNHLMCDNTLSSLLSLPSDSEDPESWELLRCDYSEDASPLYDFIQCQVLMNKYTSNLIDNIDQVSVATSLIPDVDADKKNWLKDQLLLSQLVLTEDEVADEQYQIKSWGASLSLS